MKNFNRPCSHGHHGSKRRKLVQHAHSCGSHAIAHTLTSTQLQPRCAKRQLSYYRIWRPGVFSPRSLPCGIAGLSVANWRNTHTHVDRMQSLTHLHPHSYNHVVQSASSAITEFGGRGFLVRVLSPVESQGFQFDLTFLNLPTSVMYYSMTMALMLRVLINREHVFISWTSAIHHTVTMALMLCALITVNTNTVTENLRTCRHLHAL